MPIDCNRTVVQAEYDDIWEAAWARGECLWQQQGIESRQTIPPQLGQGEIREIELRPGLWIAIESSVFWRSLHLDFRIDSMDGLFSSFYLAGSQRVINPGIEREDDREESAGDNCLCYLAGTRCLNYRPANQQFQHLSIAVDFEQLRTFDSAGASLSPLIEALVKGKSANRFHQSLSSTAAISMVLRQILENPYSGVTQRMYLEAKALELLAMQFYQLTEQPDTALTLPTLRPADRERLHQAQDILRREFEQPPSLQALAKQVGLNEFKLKQGFRQLFGTTVFGYLRVHRMEQAQQLLRDRELTVTTIAHRVGYASRSQFSRAFKQTVGMTPREYRNSL